MIAFAAATTGLWLAFATASHHARLLAAALMGGRRGRHALHRHGCPRCGVPPTAESALQPLNSTNALTQLPVLLVMLIVVISFALALNRMSSRQFKA